MIHLGLTPDEARMVFVLAKQVEAADKNEAAVSVARGLAAKLERYVGLCAANTEVGDGQE